MLTATEFIPTTTALLIVLWIEAVVYLGIGLYETFDDFIHKAPKWAFINDRVNSWIWMQDKIGHKMHAAICFMLGFVALNGAIEGMVSRFEIEIIFVSFALLSGMIFGLMPMGGRLALVMVATKPEIILQVIMYIFCASLIRPEILGLCVLLNLWGIFVYFRKTSKVIGGKYEVLRSDMLEAGADAVVERMDKVMGFEPVEEEQTNSDPAGETSS
jgi:hypothetical protein